MTIRRILTALLVLALIPGLCAGAEGLVPEGEAPGETEEALWTEDMADAEAAPAPVGFAVAAGDGVAIDGAAFPDDRFRAIVIDRFDENGDGWLSSAELDAVKTMDVSNSYIWSLQGIEYFTNLRKLDCSMNWIASLDISANTELRELKCNTNDLTDLDVSRNPKLQWLYCMGNKLQALDVGNNPKLAGLYCNYNPLMALDVSRNPALKDLYSGHTQLTQLDVTHNPKLRELHVPDNQLSALDLGNNPQLRLLNCEENGIDQIDLGACEALRRIVGRLPVSATSDAVSWCEVSDVRQVNVPRRTVLTNGAKKLYRKGKPTSISFGKKTITLRRADLKGKKYWFALKVKPAGTVSGCTFTSSKKNVLSVRSDGLILSMKAGRTKLTVRTANGLRASVTVIVK